MEMTMKFKELIELIKQAGYSPGFHSIDNYCLAVSCDNPTDFVLEVIAVSVNNQVKFNEYDVINLCSLLSGSKVSSDYLGTVIYWSKIKWQEIEEDFDSENAEVELPELDEEYAKMEFNELRNALNHG